MVNVSGIYELVQLVTDLFPVFVIFSLIGLFLFLLTKMIGGNSSIGEKFNISKKMIIAMLGLTLLLLSSFSMAGNAAEGISIDTNIIFGGSILTVEATGLTVATEYTIFATGNAAAVDNVTFIASSTTEFIPMPVPDEADRSYTLNIAASTAGIAAAAVGTRFVSLTDPTGFLPTDMFLNLLVPIILLLIIVGVVISLKTGLGGSEGGRR